MEIEEDKETKTTMSDEEAVEIVASTICKFGDGKWGDDMIEKHLMWIRRNRIEADLFDVVENPYQITYDEICTLSHKSTNLIIGNLIGICTLVRKSWSKQDLQYCAQAIMNKSNITTNIFIGSPATLTSNQTGDLNAIGACSKQVLSKKKVKNKK